MGFIRLLLAISVIAYHYYPYSKIFSGFGTELAVNAFFIISGFYMTLIISEKYSLKQNAYKMFLTNRFLRIYPIYWIILILTILFNFYLLKSGSIVNLFVYRHPFDILSDFTLLIRSDYSNIYALFNNYPTVNVAWTLVIELVFYIIAPFIVRRKLWIIVSLIIVSIIIKYGIAYYEMLHHTWQRSGFFLASLCFFMLGVVSYRIYTQIKKRKIPKKFSLALLLVIIFITIFWAFVPSIFTLHKFYLKDWGYYFLLTVSIPVIFLSFKSNFLEILMGKISYPVYVSHFLVGSFFINVFGFKNYTFGIFIVTIIGTMIFSYILLRFIDEPIDKYRQQRLKNIK